jgi:hypothetical protein
LLFLQRLSALLLLSALVIEAVAFRASGWGWDVERQQ